MSTADTESQSDTDTAEDESPNKHTEFIVEAGTFDEFLEIVGAVVDEAILHFEEDGLDVTAVDPAGVCMVETTLDAESMESYQAGGGQIGISIDRLQDIAGLASADGLLTLSLNPDTRKLDIVGEGFDYEYATIDPQNIRQEPTIPDLEHTSEIVIDADDLERVETGAGMLEDHIRFETTTDGPVLQVEADGDTDKLRFEFSENQLEAVDALDDVGSLFSLNYVDNVVSPMAGPVTTRLGDQLPVRFEFEAASGPVTYLIAPRIERS